MSDFKFSDSVSWRLVQIFQEAIMTGVDGADLLRLVRLEVDESDPTVLVLTPAYQRQVKESHARMEAEAQAIQAARAKSGLIGDPGESN